ncbi:DUF2958 domain-containing protein [Granulosicoccus sp. 3-233]|uniref:DUF2958 domain-containing protein n=1 Tax=Granulosicoccus sp. 3-233 TaxID=3417969 RepID=UPI003D351810
MEFHPWRPLLLPEDIEKLIANGKIVEETGASDFYPVVKLFGGPCTWLLTDVHPDYPDIASGLCDLGLGFPELGSVMVSEIESLFIVTIERDAFFEAKAPISVYARHARAAGYIVEDF